MTIRSSEIKFQTWIVRLDIQITAIIELSKVSPLDCGLIITLTTIGVVSFGVNAEDFPDSAGTCRALRAVSSAVYAGAAKKVIRKNTTATRKNVFSHDPRRDKYLVEKSVKLFGTHVLLNIQYSADVFVFRSDIDVDFGQLSAYVFGNFRFVRG
jgi:hypothetical protein